MTNIWNNLQTRGWNVSMLVNLLVIRFIRDIWWHNIMITNITIRSFIHMLIWFWVRQINIITNWIMMTQTCDIMFNWDFFVNSTNLWLRNNGNIRNYIVLNWRYIMFVNAILCCRLIEMPVAIFGLMYISLLHWVPPVWVFISPTGWTQIRALISKMTMFPAMKTNTFHLITWERTPVWSLLGRIFHCGLFDWN